MIKKNKIMVFKHEDPQNSLGSLFKYKFFATLGQTLNPYV